MPQTSTTVFSLATPTPQTGGIQMVPFHINSPETALGMPINSAPPFAQAVSSFVYVLIRFARLSDVQAPFREKVPTASR